ncbi:ABC transporter ATP-binding protein [Spirochaetia bacterium]|nr:ABC transporter ATP-binding protein [Spirochaetia bacterium]
MSDIAIKVEHLYKEYKLGVISHGTLYRDMQSWWAKVRGKEDPNSLVSSHHGEQAEKDSFLALNDVSFEIKEGDRVGIIGRNGAGKSTLLKILSRITSPTKGNIVIRGRVGSLLEVGTGFHSELTGRENVFLNGSILGMNRHEISRKLDEIVDFAGIEKHLDTPVKRYSSGMTVRLAFAVAAHLDADILIADEVLAVGDAEFQKKALGKMQDLSTSEGRTILFVSHNMDAIGILCAKGILLEQGTIKLFANNVEDVIKLYLFTDSSLSTWKNSDHSYSNPYFLPMEFFIGDCAANKLSMPVRNDDDFYVHISGQIENLDPALQIGYAIYDEKGSLLYWTCFTDGKKEKMPVLIIGHNHIYSKIPERFLNEGIYRIEMIVALYYREWICEPTKHSPDIRLEISGGLSESPYFTVKRPGILSPVMQWFQK